MDVLQGNRAIKRLLTIFSVCCILLTLLYASRDRISSIGYIDQPDLEDSLANLSESENNLDYVEVELDEPPRLTPLTKITLAACKERRKKYREMIDARAYSRTLKFDLDGKLTNVPFTVAVTQDLADNTCYSSQERYNAFKHEIDDAVNLCNALEQPANRTTVVLRLEIDNLFTDDAVLNLRALLAEVGWYMGYDISILQIIGTSYDVDKVPIEFRRLLTNFDNDSVFSGYPEETEAKSKIDRAGLNYQRGDGFSHYATTFYQFPQIWFMSHHKEYAFAYFLDSHVRHTGSYGTLFTNLIKAGPAAVDLITLDPIHVTKPSVLWGPNQAALPESYYKTRLIVHGISSRAVHAMNRTLFEGVNAPHEGFLPAVAIKNDLVVAMFAHPIIKRTDARLFETYTLPYGRDWPILNNNGALKTNISNDGEDTIFKEQTVWQYGGSFAADATRWVVDSFQTKWIDDVYQKWKHEERECLPGILIYPVSGR